MKCVGNFIYDHGIEVLSETLKANNTLTRLNLEGSF